MQIMKLLRINMGNHENNATLVNPRENLKNKENHKIKNEKRNLSFLKNQTENQNQNSDSKIINRNDVNKKCQNKHRRRQNYNY